MAMNALPLQQQPVPPASLQGLFGGAPPQLHRTYSELYGDPACDPFGGNYANFYHEYSVGGPTPANLRNSLYNSGNAGTFIHVLVHIREPNAPVDDPGYIVAYHRLTCHVARFGQPGQPYDGHGHAFLGDVVNGQVPASVLIPDALYNQLPVVQVPTAGRIDQLLLADPNLALVGPCNAGEPDVVPVTTRGLVIVPNEYAQPFLTMGQRPAEAYQTIRGLLPQRGHEVACKGLLDWMRVALTRQAPDAPPRTAVALLSVPMYIPPHAHHAFVQHRVDIAHRDLPMLSTAAQQQGAQVIAQGLSTLVHEQRLARQEAAEQRRVRDAKKTPRNLYKVLLERLMRWAQVVDEADLPPIHEDLANTKKNNMRGLLQKAVEDCLFANDYVEDFPVSTALASKITDLLWYTGTPDDFSCGLNVFAVGALDADAVEYQWQQNRHADLLTANEGSATLGDIAEVTTPKGDIALPRTFAQLRYQLQRMYALWSVLLGSQHPLTTGYRAFLDQLVKKEKFLETVEAFNPGQRHIVPALVGRWLQLRTNLWLQEQSQSPEIVAVPPFTSLFHLIALSEHWEPRFPMKYLEPAVGKGTPTSATAKTDAVSTISTITPHTATTSQASPKSTTLRSDTYNMAFQPYKAMGIRTSTLREHLKDEKVAIPKNSKGQELCLAWHVVGMCNTNCKRSTTHCPQTPEDDAALLAWCAPNYTLSA